MKLLVAVFAAITFCAVLLGFVVNVLPILALFGKVAALISLIGLVISGVAFATEEGIPLFDFHAEDVLP